MKNVRGTGLSLALGLGLALSIVGFAQTTTQTAQTSKTESCCSMPSCCKDGKGESCSMKDHAKKKDTKSHSAKDGCCNGDSCNLKTHDSTKQNHSAKEGCCCTGDSCPMNREMKEHAQKDHTKKDHAQMHPAMHAEKDGCCCCSGDSCEMKMANDQEKAKG